MVDNFEVLVVILLTIEESENQLFSGIPEYVEFSTNVPATVFFTTDGETPTSGSEIAVGRVFMPTDGTTFSLKAIAISGAFSSDILEISYFTEQSDLDRARLIGDEGITVLSAGGTPVDNLAVDSDGNPAQETEVPVVDLDIVTSEVNRIGEENPGRTSKDFINFATVTITKDNSFKISDVSSDNFDPTAKVIVIDGSTQEAIDNQSVRIINRPNNTMAPTSRFYNPHMEQWPLISGNLVRPMYNPKTGKAVFYYTESRENRWIKSIQEVEYNTVTISPSKKTLVFRWVDERGMAKLML